MFIHPQRQETGLGNTRYLLRMPVGASVAEERSESTPRTAVGDLSHCLCVGGSRSGFLRGGRSGRRRGLGALRPVPAVPRGEPAHLFVKGCVSRLYFVQVCGGLIPDAGCHGVRRLPFPVESLQGLLLESGQALGRRLALLRGISFLGSQGELEPLAAGQACSRPSRPAGPG